MKNVYLVQTDTTMGYQNTVIYLPYTVGLIAAAAWSDDVVKREYRFKDFIYIRHHIADIVATLDTPYLVGFSCYCWNTEFNKMLAREIKKSFPDCIVVFAGHNVPNDTTFLETYEYIDILIHGEGEKPFKNTLISLAKSFDSLSGVHNISYRDAVGHCVKTDESPPGPLDTPSPYLEGWFDDIVRKHPEITFNAVIETSRGCPHQCSYCDWGALCSAPRYAPIERILAEINWLADHNISFLWGADANFGSHKRDIDIVEALARAKSRTGYPERMRINYSKNHFDNVFQIVKKLKDYDFDRLGSTLSFQSMNPDVLKNIGRKNMSVEYFRKLVERYNEEGIKTYSELILGLPGETYDSFIQGIGTLFEMGQHFVFEVYCCNIIPNAGMADPKYIEKYGIKTVDVEMLRPHSRKDADEIPEYYRVVVGTNTMRTPEWIAAITYSEMVRVLHSFGFLRAAAIYLYQTQSVPYHLFYDKLMNYFETHDSLYVSSLYRKVKRHFTKMANGHDDEDMTFAPSGDGVWQDCEYVTLCIVEKIDLFYTEIFDYLASYAIPPDVLIDLIAYQKGILRVPGKSSVRISFRYNVHEFITNVYLGKPTSLQECPNTLVANDSEVYDNWPDYSRYIVWYGRLGWKSHMDSIRVEKTDSVCGAAEPEVRE